jgi:predicted transcriptional regulator
MPALLLQSAAYVKQKRCDADDRWPGLLTRKLGRIVVMERGNTGYTRCMAKVMISLPDELLARVDAHASERGSTRSATLRELAEVGLGERQRRLAERMAGLEGKAGRHGGTAVEDLKASRPA